MLPQAGVAGADVVEAGIDGAMVHQPDRLTGEQPLDAAHGVRTDVRRKAVTQRDRAAS